MAIPTFLHLSTADICQALDGASARIVFCASGVGQQVASALVNARRRLGRDRIHVVLDVNDASARLGYGEFDAVTLLAESDVEIRLERGLRTCVMVCDNSGFAFFLPPMLVEIPDDEHVGVNAMAMHPLQVQDVVESVLSTPDVKPQLGAEPLTEQRLTEVKEALEANPPQKFDIARKVTVFNQVVEFTELSLTGLRMATHTVQLPRELTTALRDDATARRLLTTFRLIEPDSRVAKESDAITRKVRALRERFTRSLGEEFGNVILRSKRAEFAAAVETIREEIHAFQSQIAERLEKEINASRKKLVEGLLPIMKEKPPEALANQITKKPTVDILRRYLDDELKKVFPSIDTLVREMKLDWVPKGVTFETLRNSTFQERVVAAFPYENWDEAFKVFGAAPSVTPLLPLFPTGHSLPA